MKTKLLILLSLLVIVGAVQFAYWRGEKSGYYDGFLKGRDWGVQSVLNEVFKSK